MNIFLSSFLSFILLYKYWALFLIIFSSSFLLPLPANTILLAMGAFASQGYTNVFIVLFLSIGTNVLADCFGFFLTYKYGKVVMDKLMKRWDGAFLRIERYLRTYAFGTVFLTRIVGPFAPYVNFLSGLIGVPFLRFFIADILGNSIGISFFVIAGYILGNYWEKFVDDIWVIGAIVFVIFLLYLGYKTIAQRRARRII